MRRTLLAAVALLLLLGGCGKSEAPRSPKPKTEVARVAVGTSPVGIAATASGDLWVVVADGDLLVRLRPGDSKPTAQVPVPGTPLRVTAAEGGAALWVTAFRAGAVVRVDTGTMKVTDRIAVGAGAEGVAEAFGSIWVVAQDDGLLVQVDPATRKVVHQVDVAPGVRLVVPGPDALWLDDHVAGAVVRVDPKTFAVVRSDHVCDGPEDVVAGSDTIWATCSVSQELVALSATDLQVTKRIPLRGTPDAITAAPDGSLLVVLQDGPTLVRLDGSSGKELSRTRLAGYKQLYDRSNLDLVVTGKDAWITSFVGGSVFRTPWQT
ncbi:streptogramin lyase [Marmoricola sp. URHA0025 HA25]